tara:strand:+ start:90 stop:245 length:156 start_codon:yes stop_codon:yes gene_type:complete
VETKTIQIGQENYEEIIDFAPHNEVNILNSFYFKYPYFDHNFCIEQIGLPQ